jgi:hypothetical protein
VARIRTFIRTGTAMAVLLAVASLTACGNRDATNTADTAARPVGNDTVRTPAYTAIALDNSKVRVPTAGKTNVLFFFSVGCGECIPAIKRIDAARAQTPDARYFAIDVNPGDTADVLRDFRDQVGDLHVPLVRDTHGNLAAAYRVTSLGTTFVLDRTGKQVYSGVDPATATVVHGVAKASR